MLQQLSHTFYSTHKPNWNEHTREMLTWAPAKWSDFDHLEWARLSLDYRSPNILSRMLVIRRIVVHQDGLPQSGRQRRPIKSRTKYYNFHLHIC
jgi:hypothetical protein